MQHPQLNEEVLDIAVYNEYIIRNEDGTLQPAQKGLDIAEKMIVLRPTLLFEFNVVKSVDMVALIYLFVDSMIESGHIEDSE
jgi:hypothetical protein